MFSPQSLQVAYVVTIVGPDQPGVLSQICDVVTERGGSMADCRMTRLAGRFTGILVIDAPTSISADDLDLAFDPVRQRGIVLDVRPLGPGLAVGQHAFNTEAYIISSAGSDRAGILRDVTQKVATLGGNFVEATITVVPKPGGVDYVLTLEIDVPKHVSYDFVKAAIREIELGSGNQFVVTRAAPDVPGS